MIGIIRKLRELYDILVTIAADVVNLDGDAMVGTDGAATVADGWDAALATILDNFTALRIGYLDELAAANLPTDIANINGLIVALNDLSAAQVEAECVDALQAWLVDAIAGVASPGGVPIVDSYLDYIMNINVGQTFDRTTDSLEALSVAIAGVGGSVAVLQILATTADLHQIAGTYDIATCGVDDIIIESVTFSSRLNITDDAGAFTAVTIQTDQATEQELMDNFDGDKSELTAEAQYSWIGRCLLRVGDKLQFTLEGGTAEIDPSTCDVVIEWRATGAGATFA